MTRSRVCACHEIAHGYLGEEVRRHFMRIPWFTASESRAPVARIHGSQPRVAPRPSGAMREERVPQYPLVHCLPFVSQETGAWLNVRQSQPSRFGNLKLGLKNECKGLSLSGLFQEIEWWQSSHLGFS
jgi:hypothetical protein